ncbi:MAG TPA: POTRA domain-containing protein [Steroidobacteraceae bacterium]|nr:POTRA domain-containing protein [Steroidobacteraceae bacterium]
MVGGARRSLTIRGLSIRPLLLCAGLLWLARPACADIRVEVEGVDGQLKSNVLALLSLERYKDRDRIEPEAVQRLYNRVDDEVRSALRPYGYYEPKVSESLSPPDSQHHWHVHIIIDAGTPVVLDEVHALLTGPGAEDPVFTDVLRSPPPRGEVLSHARYEQFKGALERAAATYGYLDARMVRSELRVDLATHRAAIDLELATGERYRFGATTIEQNAVRDREVRRYLRYHEGEPYNALQLLRTQFALDDSLYYSTVEVLAGDRDPATHSVPVTIRANNARRAYSLGAGYGTDTGPRGTAAWTVPRVNSYGHRFRVQMELSEIEQLFDVRYDIPVGDPALDKVSLDLRGQQDQYGDDVTNKDIAFAPSLTRTLGHWQRVLALNFEHTITDDPIEQRRVDNLVVPSIVFASVPENYLGEALFSREIYAQLIGSTPELGARERFVRLDIQAERVINLSSLWHLLLRSELGASNIRNIEDMPGLYRFFAGGDRSIRGFAYDDLSPLSVRSATRNPATGAVIPGIAAKVGGRDLLIGTVEFERDLPRNFGVAAFFDGGNALDRFDAPLAYSVGIGFRLRLPVVTVGVDIAQALRAPGFPSLPGPRLHLNISPKL